MEKEELKERIAECLRGLEIDESFSAEGIADEIGETLSDVSNVLDEMLNQKLAYQHPSYGKRDPTYTLSGKGKQYGIAVTRPKDKLPEPKDEFPEASAKDSDTLALSQKERGYEVLTKNEAECTCQYCGTTLASQGRKRNHKPVCSKNPNRNQPTPENYKARHSKPEPMPPADPDNCQCQYCGKNLATPGKRAQHEGVCGKNPNRKRPGMNPSVKHVDPEPVPLPEQERPAKRSDGLVWDESDQVPDPAEYAEAESNATVTVEHNAIADELPFAPNPDRCGGCANYLGGGCDVGCITNSSCDHARRPKEETDLADVPTVEEILGVKQTAQNLPGETIAITNSPGMAAVLRLLGFCLKVGDEGATVHLDAAIEISKEFSVHVSLHQGAE